MRPRNTTSISKVLSTCQNQHGGASRQNTMNHRGTVACALRSLGIFMPHTAENYYASEDPLRRREIQSAPEVIIPVTPRATAVSNPAVHTLITHAQQSHQCMKSFVGQSSTFRWFLRFVCSFYNHPARYKESVWFQVTEYTRDIVQRHVALNI